MTHQCLQFLMTSTLANIPYMESVHSWNKCHYATQHNRLWLHNPSVQLKHVPILCGAFTL